MLLELITALLDAFMLEGVIRDILIAVAGLFGL